jgi:phage terminase Nu1 subunit (DNA packaging protein)
MEKKMSYAEDENYDGYDLEEDAETFKQVSQLERKLAKAQAEIVRLKGEAKSWEKVFKKTVSTWLMQKPNLRQ